MEDFDIVLQVRKGDTEAFSHLVIKYHRPVLNFIYGLMFDKECVEDIGQDVFLKAYRSLDRFNIDRGIPFSAWLFTIARNNCISAMRKKRCQRHVAIEDFEDTPSHTCGIDIELVKQEQRTIIRHAIAEIPEPFKSALIDSLAGKSILDIANKNSISQGTAKSRIFRAKEKLRTIILAIFGENQHETL